MQGISLVNSEDVLIPERGRGALWKAQSTGYPEGIPVPPALRTRLQLLCAPLLTLLQKPGSPLPEGSGQNSQLSVPPAQHSPQDCISVKLDVALHHIKALGGFPGIHVWSLPDSEQLNDFSGVLRQRSASSRLEPLSLALKSSEEFRKHAC